MDAVIIPKPLAEGSKVALIGPASRIKPEIVEGLIGVFKEDDAFRGIDLIVYTSALEANASGSYAASLEQRVADFRDVWARDDIDGVICARGGYGCVHLLDYLPADFIAAHPKWLVGFSDVSALHAMLHKAGIASVHGGMAKQLVENTDCGYAPYRDALLSILKSAAPRAEYRVAPHPFNRAGEGSGVLIGGNLAVLNGLAGTPFDLMGECKAKDSILFIEDVSEPIYAVERMLYRLYLQGVLHSARGIIVGQFTVFKPDRNYDAMYDMIHDRFIQWKVKCPVAFDFPVGHSRRNVPIVESLPASLAVTSEEVVLKMG
ncbi:MAG: LD-carboxypeptidase [Muribaculaceae bacterium]|nr:LD-carboxypeptidase [Muribaculaceae bacterium]